ncbi:MAG TPA: YihY/virulence factor BrkB family protein, partial [Bacillales bacterium]|nr:YihY/virulence factor BrkB family protein [Bacillales bacterium]
TSDMVLGLFERFAPNESYNMIKKNLIMVLDVQRGGLLSFGILFAVWTASNAINALIRALNRAYNVEESRSFIVSKGIAILLTIGMIVVIIVALLLPVFGEALGSFLFTHLGLPEKFRVILIVLRWLVSFLFIVMILSCLYFFAPNKKVYFKDVIFGAVIAAVGWQVASLGFSYYVSNINNYTTTYGSLGGVIILMIWFYLTALVIIIGGEINAVNWFFERKREER